MTVKITYFVHASTPESERQLSSGWSDPGLSEAGAKQAAGLREEIKDRKFDVVFCSDLKRAVESAGLAFVGKAPIVLDRRLRECNYGVFNALPSAIVEPTQEQHLVEKFPGGESYADVTARIVDFLAHLQINYQGKSVAIVSHKAPQLVLEVLLNGKTWEQAFAEDWRKTGAWQPGWEYVLE